MMDHPAHFIASRWVCGKGHLLTSVNPATGDVVWQGNAADASDVDQAVRAARQAFGTWSMASFEDRKDYLYSFKKILTSAKEDFAHTISLENGKPLWESLNEVTAMLGKIDISIEAYAKRCQDLKQESQNRSMVTKHRPHGVIAILGPFNFPAHLPNGHIIPALLAGNTIVFKPSELTPSVAEKMVELWEKAELPGGVFNLVQGEHPTGRFLVEHPGIDGLFFTGSWRTGKLFTETFAKSHGKILALEMGGNNPLIVSDVDNLEASAYLTIQSSYLTSGQRCTCARRLIVPRGKLGDAFINSLIAMAQKLKLGSFTERPEPFMGPVISLKAAESLLTAQENLKNLGGRLLLPMSQPNKELAFLTPGLIDVTLVKDRKDEEHFGPLLQVIRVDSFEKAIEEAVNTDYGLTAGLLSNNSKEFAEFSRRLKVGQICWNCPTTNASSALPFGGTGKSGNFRPTAYYAADYCSYPATFVQGSALEMPLTPMPGIHL